MWQRQDWHFHIVSVNEDDNDQGDGDDLEGGEDGKHNNDDDGGDHWGYLPVQSRCGGKGRSTFAFPHDRKRLKYTHTTHARSLKRC